MLKIIKEIKENEKLKDEIKQLENKLIDYEWAFKNILECATSNAYSKKKDAVRDYRLGKIEEIVKDIQDKYLKEVK